MEKTGHRSLESICTYKKTSDEQRETLSAVMNQKVFKINATTTTPFSINQSSSGRHTNSQVQNSTVTATSIETKLQSVLPEFYIFNFMLLHI